MRAVDAVFGRGADEAAEQVGRKNERGDATDDEEPCGHDNGKVSEHDSRPSESEIDR